MAMVVTRDGAAYLLVGPGINSPGVAFRAGWLARADCSREERAAFMKGASSALGAAYGGAASIVNSHDQGIMMSERWAVELGVGTPGVGASRVYAIPLREAA